MEGSASRQTSKVPSVLPAIPAPCTPTQKTMQVPPIAKLPDDLLAEILSRLPAKSFFQFKCISKSFLALASDPSYQNKFPRHVSGLFLTVPSPGDAPHRTARKNIEYISLAGADDNNTIDTALSFLPRLWNLTVIYSCNGLLLCRSWVNPAPHTLGRSAPLATKRYFVCNPATREWAAIPTSSSYGGEVLALGFDPRLSRRRYHVLRFDWNKLEIFSSETGEWVKSQVCWASDGEEHHTPFVVFLNGIFYVTNGLNQVLGLDLEGKVYRKIELPGGSEDVKPRITHSGGCLHCMVRGTGKMDVWILKDSYHGEWLLKHSLSTKALSEGTGTGTEHQPWNYIPHFRTWEMHPDLDVVFFRVRLNIFSYDLNSGKLKEVCNWKQRCVLSFAFYTPCLTNGCFSDEKNASCITS